MLGTSNNDEAVFTTTITSMQIQDVPALTTIWTQPFGCQDRWMLKFDYAAPKIAYEAYSAYLGTGSLTHPLYLSCQPYTRMPTYSPAV